MNDRDDRPLEPGKIYGRTLALKPEEFANEEYLRHHLDHAIADLFGPHLERLRLPIEADVLGVDITARVYVLIATPTDGRGGTA